jgi:hypothetical protein
MASIDHSGTVRSLLLAYKTRDQTCPKPCHLLRLPAELRNRIYDELMNLYGHDGLYLMPGHSKRQSIMFPGQPALAKTCRETRYELLPIFYGQRTFTLQIEYVKALQANFSYVFGLLREVRLELPFWLWYELDDGPVLIPSRGWITVSHNDLGTLVVGPIAEAFKTKRTFCTCPLEELILETRARAFLESRNALLVLSEVLLEHKRPKVYKVDECPCRRA